MNYAYNNDKFRFVERLTPADSSRSGVSAGLSGESAAGGLLGHGDGGGEKQFLRSVLPDSAWNSGPAPTPRRNLPRRTLLQASCNESCPSIPL